MAAGSISYEDFKTAASCFIQLSDHLGDSWQLQGKEDIYLSKKTKSTLFAAESCEPGDGDRQPTLTEAHQTTTFSEAQRRLSCIGLQLADSEYLELAGIESSQVESEEDENTLSGKHDEEPVLYTFDYHIVYSRSYSVPVLYFNVYKPDGALLALDDLWTSIPVCYRETLDRWTTLTQQEHPQLGRPFFQLHPCHTAQLMGKALADGTKHLRRYLVCWLSSVGPLVHLNLPLGYSSSPF